MKQLFFAAAFMLSAVSFGQNTFPYPSSGNVGLGTVTPTELLHVNGSIRWGNSVLTNDQGGAISLRGTLNSTPYIDFYRTYGNPSAFDARFILADPNRLQLTGATLLSDSGFELLHSSYGVGYGSKIYGVDQGAGKTAFKIAVRANTTTWTDALYINAGINNGYVGLGTANPDERLTVKGKIHSEEVKVDLLVPADYVFEKYYNGTSDLKESYTMPTLQEVEKFTRENNHLPGVPSAKEIKENGLELGEMANLLLQKVEELTLYSIEQQKRIEALEAKLNASQK